MKVNDVVRSFDELKNIVQNSSVAQEYLRNVIRSEKIAVHLSKSMSVENFTVLSNKRNRKPTNTPEYIHEYIDTMYEYQYGVAYRSESLFTFVRDIEDVAKGTLFVIPVGNELNMMYVEGVIDFYLQLLEGLDTVAERVVDKIYTEDDDVIRNRLIDSISANIEFIDDEASRRRIIIDNRNALPSEVQEKILSEKFVGMVKNEILNYCDYMIKGNVITDVELSDVGRAELHINSEKFILVDPKWISSYAQTAGKSLTEVFKEFVV